MSFMKVCLYYYYMYSRAIFQCHVPVTSLCCMFAVFDQHLLESSCAQSNPISYEISSTQTLSSTLFMIFERDSFSMRKIFDMTTLLITILSYVYTGVYIIVMRRGILHRF